MLYHHLTSPLKNWHLRDKKVFLRADLNVPLDGETILDDTRLRMIQPTLNYLIQQNAQVTLATHLGNPHDSSQALSVEPLRRWLVQHGYTHNVTLLENLRSMPGEKRESAQALSPLSKTLAQQLAQGHDYYINDAFGALHRYDTSLTLVPELFPKDQRGIGFLVEEELRALEPLMTDIKRPYYAFLGGGKGADKLALVPGFLNYCDAIFLMPTLSNFFVQLITNSDIEKQVAHLRATQKIFLPLDYITSNNNWSGPFVTKMASEIDEHDFIIAIGQQTVQAWKHYIKEAQTIFFNGPMGKLEIPETVITLEELLISIANTTAFKVIGGGDSLHAIDYFKLTHQFNTCSTGGGATLAYLSGQQLPALESLL